MGAVVAGIAAGAGSVHNPIAVAMSDPWGVLHRVLDGPLHPGGTEATERLLDRAGVDGETRVLDVGCGAGESLALARDRGAFTVGIDRQPVSDSAVQGDLQWLPIGDGRVDVVLAECVLCLIPELSRCLAEIRRVLGDGGRLALSDVVVMGPIPALPDYMKEGLCLTTARGRTETLAALEEQGFEVGEIRDHRGELLALRDEVADRVDYESLLTGLGTHAEGVLEGIHALDSAVERGDLGYVSMVARVES